MHLSDDFAASCKASSHFSQTVHTNNPERPLHKPKTSLQDANFSNSEIEKYCANKTAHCTQTKQNMRRLEMF